MPESGSTWPQVKFQFAVKFGDKEVLFQEVTGLNSETQVIEYRAGNSKVYSSVKMTGLKKYGNVTMKKGIFKDAKALWEIYNQVVNNTFTRSTITISLLDEKGSVAMAWTLVNAFPCKMTVTDMNANGNEAAVETMELAHEGLTISGG